MKNNQRMEAIIAGFTQPRRSRKYFGAIILGKYAGKKLVYIGHSGSGFDDEDLRELNRRFQPLTTDRCPFEKAPHTNQPAVWLRPELVCEVKFTEWTTDKILRHPIFVGMRDDKKASNEKNEKMVKVDEKTMKAGRQELTLTHLNKIYFPKEKYTKGDVVNYYHDIAPYMLPYMMDRPQSLNRHPNGITKASFYQKNVSGKVADWVVTYRFNSESQGPI
ncbi:MAG TPA: DNA ligase, partial [Puia sp.]